MFNREELALRIAGKVMAEIPGISAGDVLPYVLSALDRHERAYNFELLKKEIVDVGCHLYSLGLMAGASGNISVRLPDDTLLITPSGISKGRMDPKDILHVNLNGDVLESSCRKPSSESKMHYHSYLKRPDVRAIVHAHPPYATGFAAAGLSLDKPVLPEAVLILGRVPLVSYATPSTWEVPQKLDPFIIDHDTFLLSNHGALCFGKTLAEAAHRMETLELCAKIIITAKILGGPRELSNDELEKLLGTFGRK